jgi:hypothetical protein
VRKARPCPVPTCREKKLREGAFFCGVHKAMIPPEIAASIAKTLPLWKAAAKGTPERALYGATMRQALAFAFASICEQLKVDLPDAPNPNAKDLKAAIFKELH